MMRILAAATIGNMVSITPAVSAVFGLFLIPLSTTFGWQRAEIAGVLGVIAIVTAVMMPVVGRFADRHGTRGMLLVGNLAFAGSIALLALSNGSLVRFYLTFALVAVSSALVCPAILSKIVSERFEQHRGAALGFSAGFGNGFGATIIPIIAAITLSEAGWRSAYLAVAAIVACGFPVYFFLLREGPTKVIERTQAEEGLSLAEAARTRTFWLMIIAIASAAGCMIAIFSHIVPILAERHIDTATATAVLSVFALGTAAWQVILGFVLDRIATPRIVIPMYLASVAGVALLEYGNGPVTLLAAGALLAIGLGTEFSALPYFIGRYFGLRHFGAIIGVCYSAVYILQGSVPILLDRAFDVQGTYRSALFAICVCLVLGAGLLSFLPRYERAVARKESKVYCNGTLQTGEQCPTTKL